MKCWPLEKMDIRCKSLYWYYYSILNEAEFFRRPFSVLSEKEGGRHYLNVILNFSLCIFCLLVRLEKDNFLSFAFIWFSRGRILFTAKFQKVARVAGNCRPRAGVSMSSHLESYPQMLLHTAEMVAVRSLCCPGRGRFWSSSRAFLPSAPPSVFRVTLPPTLPASPKWVSCCRCGGCKGPFGLYPVPVSGSCEMAIRIDPKMPMLPAAAPGLKYIYLYLYLFLVYLGSRNWEISEISVIFGGDEGAGEGTESPRKAPRDRRGGPGAAKGQADGEDGEQVSGGGTVR